MIKSVINAIGFTAVIVGYGGMAGAVELNKSLSVPLLIVIGGALLLGSTTIWEILADDKKNRSDYINGRNFDTRPYFLRR